MSLENLKRHGVTTETVENFMVDAATVYTFTKAQYDTPAEWTPLGATRDGNSFTVEQDIREMPIDGVKGPLKGARRVVEVRPQLVANLIEMSAEKFLHALPGAESEAHPEGTPTHVKITRSLQIALTDYIDYVALVGTISGTSQPIVCIIKNALAGENLEINTAEADEAALTLTFTGHFDPADLEAQVDAFAEEPWEIWYPTESES